MDGIGISTGKTVFPVVGFEGAGPSGSPPTGKTPFTPLD